MNDFDRARALGWERNAGGTWSRTCGNKYMAVNGHMGKYRAAVNHVQICRGHGFWESIQLCEQATIFEPIANDYLSWDNDIVLKFQNDHSTEKLSKLAEYLDEESSIDTYSYEETQAIKKFLRDFVLALDNGL